MNNLGVPESALALIGTAKYDDDIVTEAFDLVLILFANNKNVKRSLLNK